MTDLNPALFFITGLIVGILLCFAIFATAADNDDDAE